MSYEMLLILMKIIWGAAVTVGAAFGITEYCYQCKIRRREKVYEE